MVIVQLSGGLGNQMFEYALYLSLKAKGKVVKIDDITCYEGPGTRPKQLDVFGVSYERANKAGADGNDGFFPGSRLTYPAKAHRA